MEAEFAKWFVDKTFSTDWTSRFFPVWDSVLARRRHEPLDVLEIGSWEGLSAVFFLNYLPGCRLTCIDTFEGSAEHALKPHWSAALPHIEQRFDANLAGFDGRVRKIKSASYDALAQLVTEKRRFDLVYIDGSHHSADVQTDAVLTWPMLKDGGVAIFDDYEWNFYPEDVRHPKLGIDSFLQMRPGHYRELHRGYQLIVEKTEQAALPDIQGN